MAIVMQKKAIEKNSCMIEFKIQDYDEAAIPVSNITAATITLRDKSTGEIINYLEDENVLGNINDEGQFSYELGAAYNIIVSTSNMTDYETHVATIVITSNKGGNNIEIEREIWIQVKNEQYVS